MKKPKTPGASAPFETRSAKMKSFFPPILLGVLVSACDQSADPRPNGTYGVEVKTDKITYAQEDSILVSIRNTGDEVVLSEVECGWSLWQEGGSSWLPVDEAFCYGISQQLQPVHPGETARFRSQLNYGTGSYRYTFQLWQASEDRPALPESERTSNVFSVNPGMPKAPDYIVFGRYYGECFGEHCREMFKIDYGLLFEDTLDHYPSGLYTGNFVLLDGIKFSSVRHVRETIPEDIFTLTDGRIGQPDAHDQGGVYVELERNGRRHFWLIDTIESRIPEFLHPVVDTVLNAVRRLQ